MVFPLLKQILTKPIKTGLFGGFLFFIILILWGLIEPYVLEVRSEVAIVPQLPDSWNGKQIGQVSDFQIGMWMQNTHTARHSIDVLVKHRLAVVILTGDFIYESLPNPDDEITKVIDIIQPLLSANIPTYGVLGNHDYSHKPPIESLGQKVERSLEESGVKVLQNEAIALHRPDDDRPESSLYLVGIGSRIAGHENVDQALSELPKDSPRIVAMHNPISFKSFPARTAPFAMAGHTHGGQIRILFLPHWTWLSLVDSMPDRGSGWAEDYGELGNHLYINRGIGFSDIPIRINCRSEVTLFTLRSS